MSDSTFWHLAVAAGTALPYLLFAGLAGLLVAAGWTSPRSEPRHRRGQR